MKRIKSRIHGRVIAAVTIVTAFLFGMTPMTAYAGGYDCCCEEKCTEDHINPECDLCKFDYKCCCGEDKSETVSDLEVTQKPTPEPVVEPTPEPEEPMGPLTPDGNMNLVDDYGAPSKAGKQFITVTSKSGNYFYIIIDRDDKGNETVHFLNQVDEADLLALMDEDAVNEYIAAKGAKEDPAVTEEPEPTKESEAEDPAEEKAEKKSSGGALVLVVIIGLGGAGAYIYFTKVKNKKPKQESRVDPDADYNEDEENYIEGLQEEVEEIMEAEKRENAAKPQEIDFDEEPEEDPDEDEEE